MMPTEYYIGPPLLEPTPEHAEEKVLVQNPKSSVVSFHPEDGAMQRLFDNDSSLHRVCKACPSRYTLLFLLRALSASRHVKELALDCCGMLDKDDAKPLAETILSCRGITRLQVGGPFQPDFLSALLKGLKHRSSPLELRICNAVMTPDVVDQLNRLLQNPVIRLRLRGAKLPKD